MRQLGSLLNSSPACLLLCPWSSSSSSLFYGSSRIRSGRPLAELLRLGRGVAPVLLLDAHRVSGHGGLPAGVCIRRSSYSGRISQGRASLSATTDCCLCSNHSHGTFREGLGKQGRELQISPRLDEGVFLL